MVKPDIRHNYYADLELPTNASIDDIRKSYRKLALQYHPDRNGGREDECVPKFQAIQAAHEVLGDPIIKQKYDNDRRKAGLYPSFNTGSRSATPSNPYAATSAYPPPPRRTQAPTAQRPTSSGPPPPSSAANGADRFSNFPQPGVGKKDPAQDRANVFKAWQNMQSASIPERQQRPPPQPNQRPPPGPPPQPQPQTNRPRPPPPPPPPRQEPKIPTEEQIRAGMKYKAPPPFDPEGADKRQSAWSAFQQANAGKAGMPQGNAFNAPRKPFNPAAPGPEAAGGLGRGRPTVNVPPARPRGPPPTSSPETPISPKTQRPRPEPLKPFKDRPPNDQIPFAEGNRVSTPYTRSYTGGEKTDFFGEGLRRSHSVRDTSKLYPQDGGSRARARSTSPHRTKEKTQDDADRNKFDLSESSEEPASDADMAHSQEEAHDSTFQDPQRPGTAPNESSPFSRPKKVPTAPSSRFNGTRSGPSSPPPGMQKPHGAAGRAQSDSEQRGSQHDPRSNMYADPSDSSSSFSSSSFNSQIWTSQMFGSYSTNGAGCGSSTVPKWAIPSSLNPVLRCDDIEYRKPCKESFVTAADQRFINATKDEREAYLRFQSELRKDYEIVPDNLDMDIFLKLALMSRRDESSGDAVLDATLTRVLLVFATVGVPQSDMADEQQYASSFDFAPEPDPYATNNARSRSEEHVVNTTFSPEGWKGEFVGEPDYFAPPRSTGRKQPSPTRRTPNRTPTSHPRSTTMDDYHTTPYEEVPQRPWGSDGTPNESQRFTPAESGFDKAGWERKFQDPTWTWPPPPPNPPSPGKGGASARKSSQNRKGSKAGTKKGTGTRDQPHVVDDNDVAGPGGVHERGESPVPVDIGDAMDIDDTPPSHHHDSQANDRSPINEHAKGARVYSVPPSEWRQQQEQKHKSHRKSSSASRKSQRPATNGGTKFNANLDDLRDSLAQSTNPSDGLNMGNMGSSLPWQSQASTTMYGDPQLPRDLIVPPVPKSPAEPQKLSKASWLAHAAAFGEYMKSFHNFNSTLLQHFTTREQQAQAQIAGGMAWLEATGDTSGRLTAPTGFGNYMRGVKEDEKVRETWTLAWEKHTDAIRGFEKVRDRVRRLVVGGMLTEN